MIKVDGSSTVFPVTESVAGHFHQTQSKIKVDVAFSGTGGGFKKFCAGETDINNASRPILTEEMEACRKAGVRYIELPIGFDALTVVVHPQNEGTVFEGKSQLNLKIEELLQKEAKF